MSLEAPWLRKLHVNDVLLAKFMQNVYFFQGMVFLHILVHIKVITRPCVFWEKRLRHASCVSRDTGTEKVPLEKMKQKRKY